MKLELSGPGLKVPVVTSGFVL